MSTAVRAEAAAQHSELVDLRRRLHARPELGLELPETQAILLKELDGLGLEVSTGRELTSVTAVLRGTGAHAGSHVGPRRTVLLRSDMDALPVHEQTGLAFASAVEGRMHACGHDLHMAMLVGAARILAARRSELPGDVVLMFQPGEEGYDGASRMIAEGVLEAAGTVPDEAYGIHVMSARYPRGVFGTRPGAVMAASDRLSVTVVGRGGHGSTPHYTRDPITAAAAMVTALQTMVARRFDVFDPVVISVGTFHAGTQRNIIPDRARFEATVRTFSAAARERVRELVLALCAATAEAYGVSAEVDYQPAYPVTASDPACSAAAAATCAEVLGGERYRSLRHPDPGAEDFSRVLERVPGAFLIVGAAPEGVADPPSNHSPDVVFDESVIAPGAAVFAALGIAALGREPGISDNGTTA